MIKLKDFCPESAQDNKIRALLEALDAQIEQLIQDSRCVLHLPRLDELSGKILDLLAWQMHCDFYNSIEFSDEKKRQAIRDSIKDHRIRGTPYAVEKICADLNHPVRLSEWWQDGDEPGWFRLSTVPFYKNVAWEEWIRGVILSKNVRSWCQVRFEHTENTALYFGNADFISGSCTVNYAPPDTSTEMTICAGVQTYVHGSITVGIARPSKETLPAFLGVANFLYGSMTIGIAPDIAPDIAPLLLSGNWLKLYFNFPSNIREITLQNPREDLTKQEIKDVGQFVAEKDLLTNAENESTTGIIRADLITQNNYKIF